MKILKYISLILILAIAFVSCENDKDIIEIDETTFVAPVLSGITADESFVLVEDTTGTLEWAAISWTKADYGELLATTYTLQIDKIGNNFANSVEFNNGSEIELSVLVEEINSRLFNMEDDYYPPLVEANVEMRVMAEVSEHLNTLYSNVIEFYITPYDIGKPKLYVTGTHQLTEWDFASAPKLYSIDEDETYIGYVYLTDCEYLLNKTPDYYFGEGASAGTIVVDGTNFTNSTEGMYYMTVDTLAATISTEVRNWGIIGSCTPTGWDSDTDMEFDLELGKYKLTLDLTASDDLETTGIKFRANDAWDINLGDTGADGILDYGGTNIAITEAGNYTIYLNMKNPENITYELVKN